jgi:hypothetical protein
MADQEDARKNDKMWQAMRDVKEPLGELVMQFANLEDATTAAINSLIRLRPREGWVLEALMQNFSARIDLFSALVELNCSDKELKNIALKLASRMREANSDRNNLIHDAWTIYFPDSDTLGKVRYKVENGKLRQLAIVHEVRPKDVKDTADFVERITLALNHWRWCFQQKDRPESWPAPLPEKFYAGSPLHSRARNRRTKATPRPPRSSRE